jgi:hypothetical protein
MFFLTLAASKYISRVILPDGTKTIVVFSHFHGNVADDTSCQQLCFDSGTTYATVTGSSTTKTCVCGNASSSVDLTCSVDASDLELVTGECTCGLIYIRGAWLVNDHLMSLVSLQPYSTSENAILKPTAKITFEKYRWNWNAHQPSIDMPAGEISNNFYYAMDYNVSVRGISPNGRMSAALTFPLRVLDPVDIDLGIAEMYADVDKTLDIKATVKQGTNFNVMWTYEGNGSNKNTGMSPIV